MMPLKLIAGIAFVAIGIWSIGHYFRGMSAPRPASMARAPALE